VKSEIPPRRPRFRFSIMTLMVLTFVVAAASAPGYYLVHANAGLPQARLIGMLMMLAGPLLLMTVLSVLMSLFGRGR